MSESVSDLIMKYYNVFLGLEKYARGQGQCMFDPLLKWSDLCHLLSNSVVLSNKFKKRFDCDEDLAKFMINLPLVNVVPGSKTWNGTNELFHKVGGYKDIKFISNKVIRAAKKSILSVINDINNLNILEYLYYLLEDFVILESLDFDEKNHYIKDIVFKYRNLIKGY